jgi:hypothetical protein
MKRTIGLIFILALLTSAKFARADGHGQAVMGTLLGGALIGIGGASLATDSSACAAQDYAACAKIPLDILEIAGGAMAMAQNNKAAGQTAPGGGSSYSGVPSLNTPNTTLPPGVTVPDPNKPLVFGNDSNGNPNFQFPPKEDLQRLVQSGFENGASPDGTTLEEALAKLNDNYDKAKNAVAAYNQQALGGPSNLDANSSPFVASSQDGLSSTNNDDVGLNKGNGIRTAESEVGLDPTNPFDSNPYNSNIDLNALKKSRGETSRVKILGMNAVDSNGRSLTIFERVSRAIRGDRNRDLTLAKIEWSRKAALNKQKAPSIFAPKVKISASTLQKINAANKQI